MAIHVSKQSGQDSYGKNEYTLDTEADVANLPTDKALVSPGSAAIVAQSGKVYILNASYAWVALA